MKLSAYFLKTVSVGLLTTLLIIPVKADQSRSALDLPVEVRSGYLAETKFDIPAKPDISDYIQAGLYNNPSVHSAYARWQAEIKKIAVVRGLPNPNLNFGYFLTNVETAVGPQEFKIGLTQMIPWFGKLKLNGTLQTLQAEIRLEQLQEVINSLTYNLSALYYDYYFLQRSINITIQNIELIRSWEQVVRNKYKTARAGHPDLIKTQIELIKLEDDRSTLEARRAPLLEKFRVLLNDAELTEIMIPDALPEVNGLPERLEIQKSIFDSNPRYLIAALKEELSTTGIRRARLDYYPDLGVGFDYIGTGAKLMNGTAVAESGKDPLVFMVSLNLPIWVKKNRSRISTARYQQRASEAALANLENKLASELEQIWFELEDAQRKINLYSQGLIPKSIESLRATEAAYISEQLDFLNLVDAQRRYLQFLLESERSLVQYQKAYARLEYLAGREL
ncbi:MAG: TolC family protein [Candidatus Marinimicrobia bacterium]|nr:TolC family protein [Candidatus Neomarinimicrobiota bacterium]